MQVNVEGRPSNILMTIEQIIQQKMRKLSQMVLNDIYRM